LTVRISPPAENFSGRETTLIAENSVSKIFDCFDLLRSADILGLTQNEIEFILSNYKIVYNKWQN